MNNNFVLSVLVLAGTLAACSSTKDEVRSGEEFGLAEDETECLVGKWEVDRTMPAPSTPPKDHANRGEYLVIEQVSGRTYEVSDASGTLRELMTTQYRLVNKYELESMNPVSIHGSCSHDVTFEDLNCDDDTISDRDERELDIVFESEADCDEHLYVSSGGAHGGQAHTHGQD